MKNKKNGDSILKMANIANPLPYLTKREYGLLPNLKSQLFDNRLNAAKNLFRRDLMCHFGCVNAIEFSSDGELLVSGGDDRRVMLWNFGQAIMDRGKPEQMKSVHQSNIFCLGIASDQQRIYSGGNDDLVIAHSMETKNPVEVLQHHRAVCSLSVDPYNGRIISTAGNDGRLLLFDTRDSVNECMVVSRSRKAFHGVMFHPLQEGMLVSANARDGVALWDLKSPKHPVIHYSGNNGTCQNCMSVRFNGAGTHVLALRRRLAPVLYAVHAAEPVTEFFHQDYYNSCTMKSCSFAGEGDKYVLSGSDDFNLYMWKVPEAGDEDVAAPHVVLSGHRSIVNQVRYNPHYCLIASSGVEKIIKVWSSLEYPAMRGALLEDAGAEHPREIYSHEDYVSLVHHSGQYISHNYAERSTTEDPRMMAFFDSLVQRELECLGEESDSCDGTSSVGTLRQRSDSSDSDHIVADFPPLPPKRANPNGTRSQRCPNRLARLVASRYPKNSRAQKRGSASRRSKQSRAGASKSKCMSSASAWPGAGRSRAGQGAARRGPRRSLPRAAPPAPPTPSAPSAPSSDRTDSDEPCRALFRNEGRTNRPVRRRMTLSRAAKRKSKVPSYRKAMNLRSNGTMAQDSSDSNSFTNMDYNCYDPNMAIPSTSTGYRGHSAPALFRIAEVDSDDDQSVSSRPISPRTQSGAQNIPNNLVSIIPTPINGSRDSLGDSLRVGSPESGSSSPPPGTRHRANVRRARRAGRASLQRSDSSESPPPKDAAPTPGYSNSTIARLMNETNESELESSCSEGSPRARTATLGAPGTALGTPDAALGAPGTPDTALGAPGTPDTALGAPGTPDTALGAPGTPDSGVGTVGGSSARRDQPAVDVSDDPDYQALKFRQRVKKARRNYRTHMESDSN